jgi:hypothetical protein
MMLTATESAVQGGARLVEVVVLVSLVERVVRHLGA